MHKSAGYDVPQNTVRACPLPGDALLGKYACDSEHNSGKTYVDCYGVEMDRTVALSEFVFAFYTTPVFKLERAILRFVARRPSTDHEARWLADGLLDSFAAWNREQRTATQLLLSDYRGRTRSWFMVSSIGTALQPRTRLFFGSAVLPVTGSTSADDSPGLIFRLLIGFHKLYSKVLLHAARSRLQKSSCLREFDIQ